ncbi:hypothetical protein [Blautia obeum]|uniref:hypothetical protein n=1 Tax=Blautia obeum TaxID=40520 RepID=UPI00321A3B99
MRPSSGKDTAKTKGVLFIATTMINAKNDEVILKGEIPARCIQEYRNDLTYFTNGQGVCLTELKGYQPAIGKFICQVLSGRLY